MKTNITDIIQEVKEIVTKIGVTPEQAMKILELSEKRKNNSLMEQQNKYIKIYINDKCSKGTWLLLNSVDKEVNLEGSKENE